MIRNVIDFLFIYGHFAGEDLDEDEDVEDELEEVEEGRARAGPSSETTPLLGRSKSRPRLKRTKTVHGQGTASMTQAVLMVS